MSNRRARALLWSPVLAVSAMVAADALGWFPGPWFGRVLAGATLGYFLLTGLLAALAGWQAIHRHAVPLAMAAGAGALVTSAAASPLLVWPVVSLLGGGSTHLDLSPFLFVACFVAVPGALLGVLGGWAARHERKVDAT